MSIDKINFPLEANDDIEWQKLALCATTDPEAFFPEKGAGSKEAKKVCSSCEVKDECLDYAFKNDERYGVWGGLSAYEREKLKKRMGGNVIKR